MRMLRPSGPPSAPHNGLSFAAARRLATGLLLAMACVYVFSVAFLMNTAYGPYLKAFAEAAMVGALADWFAVTALFRRPLGLPIPHTAVIPNSKERIAASLGQFIVDNFLQPDLVERRLSDIDLAGGLARQIADQNTAMRIADGIVSALPPLLDMLDDARVSNVLKGVMERQAGGVSAAPLLGEALAILTEQGRHQALIDAAIDQGWRAVSANEAALRTRVRDKTGWLWRLAGVDAKASDALIASLRETLADIAAKPDHPTRSEITRWLGGLAMELKTSPTLRARIERIKEEMLAHPAVGAYVADLWGQAKRAVRAAALNPEGVLQDNLARIIVEIGEALGDDADARAAMNQRLRPMLAGLAGRHGEDAARLVADTIRGWDTRTLTDKLEQSVGRDLQYIRINGTLVGGLVGLSIHAFTQALVTH
jgi:uncharacterized membrane-anchored protein YjiN (DUF445 family)